MECGEISLGEGLFGDSEEHLDWAKEVETSDDESSVTGSVMSGRSDETSVVKRPNRKELRERRFTLKRLIRLLHIREPVFHVLGLLGKR